MSLNRRLIEAPENISYAELYRYNHMSLRQTEQNREEKDNAD